MFHYRAIISYKGTCYRGWQFQGKAEGDEERATVQGTIHQILRRIARYGECGVVGTSRTDAGVHASGQLAKLSLPTQLEASKLLQGLNSLLPADIRIASCAPCDASFNPQTCAKEKEYHYYFSHSQVANPLLVDLVAHVPGPLDWTAMQEAAQLFVGEHDFYNFYRLGSDAATTVRTILSCELEEVDFPPMGEKVALLKVRGTGFLKQMVRYIAGAIFEVGRAGASLEELSTYLREHQEDKLSPKAKAQGLHLAKIIES